MKRLILACLGCLFLISLSQPLNAETTRAVSQEPVLVILAQLDTAMPPLHGTDQQDWVDRFFTLGANPPSVRDYFLEVSDGQLDLAPDTSENSAPAGNGVVGWYDLGHDLNHYKDRAEQQEAKHWSVIAGYDAVRLPSVAKEVNYSTYDSNGNGVIEPEELHVYVILSTYEEDGSRVWSTPISPVSKRLHYPHLTQTIDGVQIKGFAVTGEKSQPLGELPHQTKMGLIAHEMGHSIGLFDHYEGIDNVGRWCLMASGDGGGDAEYPNYPCAYARWKLGWQNAQVITDPQTVSVTGVTDTNADLFMIPKQTDGDTHFYLIENRQDQAANAFDGTLPGSGLLVWEVDDTQDPKFNARLIRPDQSRTREGDFGDILPGSTNTRSLDSSTTPALIDARIANVSDAAATMIAELGLEPPTSLSCTPDNQLPANGLSVGRIFATLMNDSGSEVHHQSRPVTFTIIAGGQSADLIEPTTVWTVDGRAECRVRATQTPGDVEIMASSPGMASCTSWVTVTDAPLTWHVATTGSDETGTGTYLAPFASVQHGVDMAQDGEVVLVAPGLYTENVVVDSKDITLASHYTLDGDESHITATILDRGPMGLESNVTFQGSISHLGASLIGFTISNGLAVTGGGLAVLEVSPRIDHCYFTGNRASSYGAGIYLGNSDALLTNLVIADNAADYMDWSVGGGLAIGSGSPRLQDVDILNNTTNAFGGGIYFINPGQAVLERVTITGNISNGRGGGVYCKSGASPTFIESEIDNNTAAYIGGGVYCDGAEAALRQTLVTNNTAGATASDVGGGGVFADYGSTVALVNTTVAGNTSNAGGGLQLRDGSTAVVVNSILWGNANAEVYANTGGTVSNLTVAYSDVEGGQAGLQTNGYALVNWGNGNIDQSPVFFPGLDGNPFHLFLGSPCIDGGTAYFLWGQDPLVALYPDQYHGAAPDMGAFEFPSILALVSPNGTSGYSSIGDAINKVPNGTIIELMDGVYSGNGNRDIDFQGRSIVIRSRDQIEGRAVIDCRDTTDVGHRAFHFHSGEGAGAVVEGVTIIGGGATAKSLPGGDYGGGVLCENGSSPTFRRVTFANCTSDSGGGAVACIESSPIIENCTFFGNSAPVGSSLHCVGSSPQVSNSLMVYGSGAAAFVDSNSHPEFTCTDIYDNAGGDWTGTLLPLLGVDGNISEDPLFCESDPAGALVWSLADNSPCLPENSPAGCAIGAWTDECMIVSSFLSTFTLRDTEAGTWIDWRTAFTAEAGDFQLSATGGDLTWTVPHEQISEFSFRALDDGSHMASDGIVTYRLSHWTEGQWYEIARQETEHRLPVLVTRIRKVFPNPFNPQLDVTFSLEKPGKAKVAIYDVAGRRVATLQDGHLPSGLHSRFWTGVDGSGRAVSSGIYFVRLETAAKVDTRKITLLR